MNDLIFTAGASLVLQEGIRWANGTIDDLQIAHTVDSEFRIDYGRWVSGWSHFGGSRWMIDKYLDRYAFCKVFPEQRGNRQLLLFLDSENKNW